MLSDKGFDKWAGEYDESITRDSEGYPFEGYYDVLAYVQSLIKIDEEVKILDIGVGTGLLTEELYKKGAKIYGVDFSEKMLEKAKEKMPEGIFYRYDFKYGLPKELEGEKFDYIVSSYAIHHITDVEKLELLQLLKNKLKKNGKVIIADVAFEYWQLLKECKLDAGELRDDDEHYIIFEDFNKDLGRLNKEVKFTQISPCAGVLEIENK